MGGSLSTAERRGCNPVRRLGPGQLAGIVWRRDADNSNSLRSENSIHPDGSTRVAVVEGKRAAVEHETVAPDGRVVAR